MSCNPGRLVALSLLLSACATPPGGPPAGPMPTYAEIAGSHNARLEGLARVHASGVVELEWTEGEKHHFEQGDAELWLDLPRQTALRISKLGDDLLWIGSDAERYWYFDLLRDPTRLISRDHAQPFDGGAGPAVRPLVLLTAMGLDPLPNHHVPPEVRWTRADESTGAAAGWAVRAPAGPSGTDRATIVFSEGDLWPLHVTVRNPQGDVLIRSRLEQYKTVPVPGKSPLASPKMAQVARIIDPSNNSEIRLYLRTWSGDVEHEPMDRVFDLDMLIAAMRPDEVH